MTVQEKIAATKVGRLQLIRFKYGRITGVRFNKHTHKMKWNFYEAYDD